MGCSVNAFTGRLPLYLIPSVPELDYNRGDQPPNVHYIGPCVWTKSTDTVPDWLNELPFDRCNNIKVVSSETRPPASCPLATTPSASVVWASCACTKQ